MILHILQVAACVALIAAAMYWKLRRSNQQGVHKFLFPFILSASVMGMALLASYAMEVFIAYYSGAIYALELVFYRFDGPYWWVFASGAILPILPIFGVFPQVGGRPVFVAFIGALAMAPFLFNYGVRFFN